MNSWRVPLTQLHFITQTATTKQNFTKQPDGYLSNLTLVWRNAFNTLPLLGLVAISWSITRLTIQLTTTDRLLTTLTREFEPHLHLNLKRQLHQQLNATSSLHFTPLFKEETQFSLIQDDDIWHKIQQCPYDSYALFITQLHDYTHAIILHIIHILCKITPAKYILKSTVTNTQINT